MRKILTGPNNKTVVFFDGSCPLCKSEMNLYNNCDSAGALFLVDISEATAMLPSILDKRIAMERFHIISHEGQMLSGAAAFIELWRQLRGWRWAAKAASLPGQASILEFAYCLFLQVRPVLVRLFLVARRLRALR